MAEPFLSEIRIFSFNFPPKGWAFCNGQFLPINQNQALFSLLGTTYGGDGRTTFALPNLQGQVPIHFGGNFSLGEKGGEAAHTLIQSEMPQHLHQLQAAGAPGTVITTGGNVLGNAGSQVYTGAQQLVPMNPLCVTNVGGSQPHPNMQPYLVLNFCIALQGIFPSRN
jgi:microcystin-dependent protein